MSQGQGPMGAGLQGQESGRISLHDEANLFARLSECQSQLVLDLLRQAADASTVEAENQQLASELADSFDRIQEVHHRIRNHLQTVTGLLSAHEITEESPTARRALQKSVARLASIAAIHDLLTRDPASGMLELPALVPQLAQHLLRSMDAEDRVSIVVEASPLELPPREATAFVLIVTEVISNALEHGFPGNASGQIGIRVSFDGDVAVLEIRDSGCGLPADFDLRKACNLGLGLAFRLAERDLGGSFSARNEGGAVFTVTFPARAQGRES
jgi:two-component sensor histidine kinase